MGEREAVQQFIEQVRWLYEPEYGDFKRKIGLYVQRLEEVHPQLKVGAGKRTFDTIRHNVVFNPNGDIESTRRQVLQLANELLAGTSSGQSVHK